MRGYIKYILLMLLLLDYSVAFATESELIANAETAIMQKDLNKAIQLYQIALRDNPSSIAATMGLAKCYFRKGQKQRVAVLLQQILVQHDNDAEALLLRGRLHLANKENDQAIEDFESVISNNPSHVEAHYHLVNSLNMAGKSVEAKAVLNKMQTLIGAKN